MGRRDAVYMIFVFIYRTARPLEPLLLVVMFRALWILSSKELIFFLLLSCELESYIYTLM